MNQLNPLHIGALLLVVLLFSFFKLSEVKKELHSAKEQYAQTQKVALELSALKDAYANTTQTRKAINRIVSQSTLRSAHLEIKRSKKAIKIGAKSIDLQALNFLMGKILNANFNIKQLEIQRVDDLHARLKLEIQW